MLCMRMTALALVLTPGVSARPQYISEISGDCASLSGWHSLGYPTGGAGSSPLPIPSGAKSPSKISNSSFVYNNTTAVPPSEFNSSISAFATSGAASVLATSASSKEATSTTVSYSTASLTPTSISSSAPITISHSSSGKLPPSSGTSALPAAQTIASGQSFDCGMVMYDRGVHCTGQIEGDDSDAVFMLENGASLSNCIIGPNQIEGVHCEGSCNLTNVWWSAVCEDAFTIKNQDAGETTTIIGGGAFGAEDKILQHNGGGTLSVSSFTADTFGKVYRSCGNCKDMMQRHVIMDNITATNGSEIAGINSNYGDTATLTNIKVADVNEICATYTGNDDGAEPPENGSGPSQYCRYDQSDSIQIN